MPPATWSASCAARFRVARSRLPSGELQEALQKSQANRPPAPVDMLTPDGAYVGTVRKLRWPAALGPGNRAAYIEVDELGIPTVLVGRLSLSSCPLG